MVYFHKIKAALNARKMAVRCGFLIFFIDFLICESELSFNYKDKGFCVKFYSKFADRLFLFCMKQINNARPDIACKVE